jgi:hypothetical protein
MSQASAPAAQRPAAQTNSGGMDTSDIATLNDALGSAGVDLRVRLANQPYIMFAKDSEMNYLCRPKKNLCKDRTNSIKPTGPTKTAVESNPQLHHSTLNSWAPPCAL